MIRVCVDNAAICLQTQTPKEYVQQLAAATDALRRARGVDKGKGGGMSDEDRTLIEEFRRQMEPEEVPSG